MSTKLLHALLLSLLVGGASSFAFATPDGQYIDNSITSHYPSSEPGAVVIVAKEGSVILRKGYGVSAIGGSPIQPSTVFRVGSISKQFTAMGILLLVQDGKMSLSDPVTRYFPEFPRFMSAISIENLLTHTSGLQNYTDLKQFSREDVDYSLEEIVLAIRDSPLLFNPGEAWRYSDSNYFLLGVILERVSGVPYCSLMATRIFGRFGMSQTRCAASDASDQVPSGYFKRDHEFTGANHRHSRFYFSAGAILSTVDDLLRWNKALTVGTLLRKDLYSRMFQGFILKSGERTFYGYGWVVHTVDGIEVIEHGGMVDGFENHILWMPSEDIFIAILSNCRGRTPAPDVLATRIALYLSSHNLPLMDAPLGPGRSDAALGHYRVADLTYEVALHDGYVGLSRVGRPWARIVQLFDGRLLLENTYTLVSFQARGEGRAGTLTVKPKYGQEILAVSEPPN